MDATQQSYDIPKFKEQYENYIGGKWASNSGPYVGVYYVRTSNSGSTWTNGCLPGITKHENAANPYDRVSDPVVAYDAKHMVWMIPSLPLCEAGGVRDVCRPSRRCAGRRRERRAGCRANSRSRGSRRGRAG